jgi:hypothetical protein
MFSTGFYKPARGTSVSFPFPQPNGVILETITGFPTGFGFGISNRGNIVIGKQDSPGLVEMDGLTSTPTGRSIPSGPDHRGTILFDSQNNPISYMQKSNENVRKWSKDWDAADDLDFIDGFRAVTNAEVHYGGGELDNGDFLGFAIPNFYRYDGFSDTVVDSFERPLLGNTGVIGTDGINLYSYDTDSKRLVVHDGFSATISYTYPAPDTATIQGISVYEGFVYLYSSSQVFKIENGPMPGVFNSGVWNDYGLWDDAHIWADSA